VVAERAALGKDWDAKHKDLQDQADLARFREEHAEALLWVRVRRETVDGIEVGTSVAAVALQIKKLGEQRVRARACVRVYMCGALGGKLSHVASCSTCIGDRGCA
jgi:predicted RNA-binding Zn ribbon-like protein